MHFESSRSTTSKDRYLGSLTLAGAPFGVSTRSHPIRPDESTLNVKISAFFPIYGAQIDIVGEQSGFSYYSQSELSFAGGDATKIISTQVCPELDQSYAFFVSDIDPSYSVNLTFYFSTSSIQIGSSSHTPLTARSIRPTYFLATSVIGLTPLGSYSTLISHDPSWGNSRINIFSITMANFGGVHAGIQFFWFFPPSIYVQCAGIFSLALGQYEQIKLPHSIATATVVTPDLVYQTYGSPVLAVDLCVYYDVG